MKKVKAPHIVIAGGPNGSGKSTFARSFLEMHKYIYLNADDIAAELNVSAFDTVRISAGKLFIQRLNQNLSLRKNIIIESTLSGGYLTNYMHKFKALGYKVTVMFVYLDNPNICIERIKERVKKGGHFVQDVDVKRRYYRAIKNFWNRYRREADNWYLIYNAEDVFEEVAMGKGDKYVLNKKEFFYIFAKNIFV